MVFCTVLHDMLFSQEVFITYVTLVGFLLNMNSFCLVLEVISTCESSAHVTDVVGIPCMCKYVPFNVPLCKEMFITLNAWILWCHKKYYVCLKTILWYTFSHILRK